jgi:tRNA G10  N-methylase Trm11
MDAKVRRAFRRTGVMPASWRVHLCNAASLPVSQPIDAVITSPPYMNELDYVRDNRLRLWFLTKEPHSAVDIAKKDRESRFRELMRATLVRLADAMSERAVFALIVGESRRGQRVIDAAAVVDELFASEPALMRFRRECMIRDLIPDVRRSRRDLRGTKAETILVYRSALRSTRA